MGENEIAGGGVVLRPVGEDDIAAMAAVLQCPGVMRWWGEFDPEDFAAELHDPEVHGFVIEHEGRAVGYIQYSEETNPQYRHASIDIALHDDHQGRGYGTAAIRALVGHLFAEVGHHRLTIDPARTNERAIGCYQQVGFQPVGVLRQYERGPDGTYHDGLLLDLLVGEAR